MCLFLNGFPKCIATRTGEERIDRTFDNIFALFKLPFYLFVTDHQKTNQQAAHTNMYPSPPPNYCVCYSLIQLVWTSNNRQLSVGRTVYQTKKSGQCFTFHRAFSRMSTSDQYLKALLLPPFFDGASSHVPYPALNFFRDRGTLSYLLCCSF